MDRHPPSATKANAPTNLYCIRKETGSAGSTIYIELITREVLDFAEPRGKCVRYSRNYQKLHPETEFKQFIQEQSSTVGAIYVAGRPYDPANIKTFPFVVDWEDPEFMY